MVRDALRGYLSLAGGLTEVTAARARAAARSLVEQGEATAGQVSALAEDLVATSRRNRESLALVIRHEVEQAVRRIGLGAAADVDTLTQRVRRLEQTIRELRAESARTTSPESSTSQPASSAGSSSAEPARKKSAAKKTTAKKTTAKKTSAKKTAKTSSSAGKAATKKAAKRSTKTATKKTAKKTARRTPSGRGRSSRRTAR